MSLRLAILGATGSIGQSALEVVRHHPERLRVVALAAYGRNLTLLAAQAREFGPDLVAVYDRQCAAALQAELGGDVRVVSGAAGLAEVATHERADRVVAAMVGAAGLRPVHAAISAGKDVALANKESLVVAGRLLTKLACEKGVRLLPIDSEHVALHQALRGGEEREVRRLLLTASGGPFLHRSLETWNQIEPLEALNHPTWQMGAKITIDSATLMNKGLELIEATHLFSMPCERIDVVIHPQSIVHSLVEFQDGSWLAQLSPNDMVFPIQYALSYPERWENRFPRLRIEELGQLEFQTVEEARFPTVALARRALVSGESAPAVLNAANEEAVHAFLQERIPFTAIVSTIQEVLEEHRPEPLTDLEQALGWDAWARERAREALAMRSRSR